MTNLIQIMKSMKVKYLGTIKDSNCFPFHIVELNENSSTVINGRPVVQGYGTRTSFTARSGDTTATVMRHGAGKIRAARAATNLVECKQDTWAYETNCVMTRQPHGVAPDSPLGANASIKLQVEQAWAVFSSKVIFLTLSQRTSDWFLARYFRFTSTTLHVAVNVKAAVYVNTNELRALHARIIGILRLKPRKTITVLNAADLEDEDLTTQRSHHMQMEGQGEQGSVIGDKRVTPNSG